MQRKRLGRAVILSLATLPIMTFSGFIAPVWAADDLVVRYDQSQLLRMPRAVSEIIIGNPSIADVTVQSGNMLVITGKTFGITNIIALDAEKNVIQDQRVVVERDERGIVNVSRAGQRQSFSCTPTCAPTITIGDESTYFNQVVQSSTTKTKFSESGSDGGGGGGGQGGQ
ncbi:MAG: pilus assembly protein N-terminal domain-containing protein [Candidatus Binatia bacterium]